MLGQPLGEIERRRAADVMGVQRGDLGREGRVGLGGLVGLLELEDQRHQGFGDEAAAVDCRNGRARRARCGRSSAGPACSRRSDPSEDAPPRAPARTKAAMRSGSLTPGALSTPDDTSTAGARVMRSASPTLWGPSPPESMKGTGRSSAARSVPVEGDAVAARQDGALGRLGVEQDLVGDGRVGRRRPSRSAAVGDAQRLDHRPAEDGRARPRRAPASRGRAAAPCRARPPPRWRRASRRRHRP